MKKYKIENEYIRVEILNYGATIFKIIIKELNRNVVLTNKDLNDYIDKTKGYFGQTVGPVANRISNGSFKINDVTYYLDKNENNKTNLHSGKEGFSNKYFDLVSKTDDSISFGLLSNNDNFPGNKEVLVKYIIDGSSLLINYEAKTDELTPFNITNHTYFNLDGINTINNHKLKLKASKYMEVDEDLIPTSKYVDVKDTSFDFRKFSKIKTDIDNHFVFDNKKELTLKTKDLSLKVKTSYPGVQLYNSVMPSGQLLINGESFTKYKGLAIEPQFEIDALNNNMRDILVKKDEVFKSWIKYEFNVLSN